MTSIRNTLLSRFDYMGSEQSRSDHHHHHHRVRGKWSSDVPHTVDERQDVLDKCGKKCFLGEGTSFPICMRLTRSGAGARTCKIDRRGVQAAYSRASEWASITSRKKRSSTNARAYRKYRAIAKRASRLLKKLPK